MIPAGTGQAIAAGGVAPFIPDKINLPPSGEFKVVNKDSVEHRVGGFRVPAETTAVIRPQVELGRLICSLHPSGELGVGTAARPSIFFMVLPVFVIAIPFGLICWFAALIGARLDMGPAPDQAS
ncbi:MAG: hypothetical protein ACE5EF_00715 [Dehalococcoidia bacterium]